MQTSKECVLRTIEMRNPDRVPIWLSLSRSRTDIGITETIIRDYESDVITTYCQDPDFVSKIKGAHWLGYKYSTLGATMGEVLDPPISDWSMFEEWKKSLPDFSKAICYENAARERQKNPDKFVCGGLFLMMEELINLRGYENYMLDLYDEEENLNALIDVLYDIGKKMVDGYANAGMDAVMAWEDWGLQNSPLMSYQLWEKYFHDKMKSFVDYIHQKGMKYILHSCGHITYLLDTFEKFGIDAIQLDQQKNMGFDALRKWRGKLCFVCPIDIQHSVSMTKEEMEQYLKSMCHNLGCEHGGYIYRAYPQPAAIDMTEQKLRTEIELAKQLTFS